MWCRYEFFLVSPNSYDDYEDDWEKEYNCTFTKNDRPCINISGRQTHKAFGLTAFQGTGVGLHISSIYGIPFIPTKDSQKSTQCIQFLKPEPYHIQVKPDRVRGYPYINAFTDDRIIEEALPKPKKPIMLISTPMKKGTSFYDQTLNMNDNAILGVKAMKAFNEEANAFAELPKTAWDYSGWRTITKKDKQVLNFKC